MDSDPTVTLAMLPDGRLALCVPAGASATARQIELKYGSELETIRRVLRAKRAPDPTHGIAIGTEASPTQAQVRHWEQHGLWPDDRCAFCRSEAQAAATSVLRAPPGQRGATAERLRAKATAEELGL